MSVRVFTNLEMMTGGVRPVLHCSQGDIRPFGFNIKWNGQAYNPEGLCVVAIVKKDGSVATVAGTIEDDKVLFETTPQMTVLDGDCAGIVTFVDGDNPVSTLRFVLAVQKDPTVEAVDSETDPTGWQAIMEAAVAAAAAAAKAWAVGPNGSGEGTDDNNAKYWAEQSHADQIQADWDEADPTAVDYIKNKPTIPDSADDITYDNTDSGLTADNVQEAIDEITADFIVEQGTNANGIYRKWNGGILECWGKFTGNGGVVTTDLPSTYKDTSYLIYYGSENGVGALPHAGSAFSTTQIKTYNTLSGQISTYYTMGTWK